MMLILLHYLFQRFHLELLLHKSQSMILVYHKAYILILLVDSAVKLAFSVYKLQIFCVLQLFWVAFLGLFHLFVMFDQGI